VTKAEAAKLVAVLIAAYPSAKLGPDTAGIYERMLVDIDYAEANAAVERLLATSKWPPTIAEIREAALALNAGEIKPGGEAWGRVLRAICRHGRNRTPGVHFDLDGDTVALDVVRALNWRELCDSDNPSADRARFIELYDQLAATARRRQLSEGLPAMQRFRALHAARRTPELAAGDMQSEQVGKLIQLVADGSRRAS
jgi:hypothetical protein